MSTALVTGASVGLGRALSTALAREGYRLVIDARGADRLGEARRTLGAHTEVTAAVGDIAEPSHRAALAEAVAAEGRLDLLVHNASTLGPTPLRPLHQLTAGQLADIFAVNVVAPNELTRVLLPLLAASAGTVLAISSDAAANAYETWGGYGASKAALDHLIGTWAVEHPALSWYAVDPGDMRTEMHQAAFPGEDISDRPLPDDVVPALLRLVHERPPSGRYLARELLAEPLTTTQP
ncbi:MAG: SDR family NAD(P)-dependent oxidoreductase [Dermatophilaceae bacterium]